MKQSVRESAIRTFEIVRAVGRVTFLEIIRDKVLYNIAVISFLLLGAGILASRLAILKQDRVILDFGLTALTLSCMLVAVLCGAGMLGREFDRRTVYVALSRPVSRLQFVAGKFAGLAAVVALNWLLLAAAYIALLALAAHGGFGQLAGGTFFCALFLVLAQALMAGALAVFFSSFTTTSLAVVFTAGVWIIGSNVSQLRWLAVKTGGGLGGALDVLALMIPNFEYFNLGLKVTYGVPVTWLYMTASLAYAVFVVLLAVLLAGMLARGKEG